MKSMPIWNVEESCDGNRGPVTLSLGGSSLFLPACTPTPNAFRVSLEFTVRNATDAEIDVCQRLRASPVLASPLAEAIGDFKTHVSFRPGVEFVLLGDDTYRSNVVVVPSERSITISSTAVITIRRNLPVGLLCLEETRKVLPDWVHGKHITISRAIDTTASDDPKLAELLAYRKKYSDSQSNDDDSTKKSSKERTVVWHAEDDADELDELAKRYKEKKNKQKQKAADSKTNSGSTSSSSSSIRPQGSTAVGSTAVDKVAVVKKRKDVDASDAAVKKKQRTDAPSLSGYNNGPEGEESEETSDSDGSNATEASGGDSKEEVSSSSSVVTSVKSKRPSVLHVVVQVGNCSDQHVPEFMTFGAATVMKKFAKAMKLKIGDKDYRGMHDNVALKDVLDVCDQVDIEDKIDTDDMDSKMFANSSYCWSISTNTDENRHVSISTLDLRLVINDHHHTLANIVKYQTNMMFLFCAGCG